MPKGLSSPPRYCDRCTKHLPGKNRSGTCWECLKPEKNKLWRQNNVEYCRRYLANYNASAEGKQAAKRSRQKPENRARRREDARKYRDRPEVKARERVRGPIKQAKRKTQKTGAGGSFSETEWQALLEAYGHICRNCGSGGKMTVDHILPISKGGSSNIDNIQPLCLSCNSAKRDS